jgi:hypothetical protein
MPLATAHCKNLPDENIQRKLSRPKPTRVAEPIEEEEGCHNVITGEERPKSDSLVPLQSRW